MHKRIYIGLAPTETIEKNKRRPFFAYHDDAFAYASDGKLYKTKNSNSLSEMDFGDPFIKGDTIMLIMEFDTLYCSFYRNDMQQGQVKIDQHKDYKLAVCFRDYMSAIEYIP